MFVSHPYALEPQKQDVIKFMFILTIILINASMLKFRTSERILEIVGARSSVW